MALAGSVGERNAADAAAMDEVMADLRSSTPDESLLDAASGVDLCWSPYVDGAKPHDAGMPKSRPRRSRYIFKAFAEMANGAQAVLANERLW